MMTPDPDSIIEEIVVELREGEELLSVPSVSRDVTWRRRRDVFIARGEMLLRRITRSDLLR